MIRHQAVLSLTTLLAAHLACADTPMPAKLSSMLHPLGPVPLAPADPIVYDSITGATLTATGSTPRTFIGGVGNLASNGVSVDVTGADFIMYSASAVAYTNIRARIMFWDDYNGNNSPVYSGPLSEVDNDLGPVTTGGGAAYALSFTFPTAVSVSKLTNEGFVVNYQGDTGAGLGNTDALSSVFTYGVPNAVGSSVISGYYRNASGETDFNFPSSDFRSVGLSERLGMRLYGKTRYGISGTINGLSGSNLQLQINGGDTQTPAPGATNFAFSGLLDGTAWTVSVANQPDSPTQTCSVASGTDSGIIAGANVTNVSVNCVTDTYTVGGSVAGLTGNGLVLQLNGDDDLPISAGASTFTFLNPLYSGSSYIVNISQQPNGQTCSLTNATGTVTNANIDAGNNPVVVSCVDAQAQLVLSIDDDHDYARYGQVLDYIVTLSNNGDAAANNVSVNSSSSAGLDLGNTQWRCFGAGGGATCAPNGTGPLTDNTVTVPPGRSVMWLVTAPVVGTTPDNDIELDISATGATSVSDIDTLVIFRDGFDVANGDGTRAPAPGSVTIFNDDTTLAFTLPPPSGNRIDVIRALRSGSDKIAVERIALGGKEYVRLLSRSAEGIERASAWGEVAASAKVVIASIAGIGNQHVMLLEGALQPLAMPIGK